MRKRRYYGRLSLAFALGGIGVVSVPVYAQKVRSLAPSIPAITRADLDSTVSPCEDFHQYATGGWYRRVSRGDRIEVKTGLEETLAGRVLRSLVEQAPALAARTSDPVFRTVGYFYGSCLADTTGTAHGVRGDTSRSAYCFRLTRDHLHRGLFELVMTHVWPLSVRQITHQFWPDMQTAAIDRFRASTALQDSTKKALLAVTPEITLYVNQGKNGHYDSTTVFWPSSDKSIVSVQSIRRKMLQLPFAEPSGATWTYRDYAALQLSPGDFPNNLARVIAAPDTLPLPVLPGSSRDTSRTNVSRVPVLDALLGQEAYGVDVGHKQVAVSLNMLIPPLADGAPDLGLWYGLIGPVVGHEMSHGTWRGGGADGYLNDRKEQAAFATEQLHGQLQTFGHPFDDMFGVLVAYDAFVRAAQRREWPKVDGFTPEQRFFLGVAYGMRGGAASFNPINNGHARWRVLTNGTLSVIPAFARAFGCKVGDPMAGGRVWYTDPWRGVRLTTEQQADLYVDSTSTVYRQAYATMLDEFKQQDPAFRMTKDQQAFLKERRALHRTQWTVQADSLAAAAGQGQNNGNAGYAHMLQLVIQQIGELRTGITQKQPAR